MKATLKNVCFTVNDTDLLTDISIDIEKGSSVLVMGPSGAGKSLLMKIMAGIIPPSSGRVYLDGRDLLRIGERELFKLRRHHGFLFQDSALWQNMTVKQNLLLPLQTHYGNWTPKQMAERINTLCRSLSFEEDLLQRPATLSFGERKLASLIRSLVLEPDLVFYDEPRSGLDIQTRERVLTLLKNQKAAGRTQIISSHDSEIASMIADFILVIDGGVVLAYESIRNISRTDDKRLLEILSGVLDLSSSYDSDILEILGSGDIDPFG